MFSCTTFWFCVLHSDQLFDSNPVVDQSGRYTLWYCQEVALGRHWGTKKRSHLSSSAVTPEEKSVFLKTSGLEAKSFPCLTWMNVCYDLMIMSRTEQK